VTHGKYECLLAVNACEVIRDSLDDVRQWHEINKDWLFGHMCYEYKDRIEQKLASSHPVSLGFPVLSFFRPQVVCYINAARTELVVESLGADAALVLDELLHASVPQREPVPFLQFQHRVGKDDYLQHLAALRRHIADGDCYEINYCTE